MPRPLLLALCVAAALRLPAQTPSAPNPQNAARTALIDSLDQLAAQQTAARRAVLSGITTRAQAEVRQAHVRAAMLHLLGPLPAKTPLNPQILGETKLPADPKAPAIRIQKILFDSQPNFHVTALLYLPDRAAPADPSQPKLPAIVIAPGHGPTGKASDFASALTFARNGFAVLSYDPIGQGERLQYPDPADSSKSLATRPTGEHGEAGLQPVLLGESVAKYFLWDGIRAVDYLLTRPEIDPARIGAYGCSGGGAMTALLGALDPRIAATATACYITSFDTLLPAIGPQDGEQSTPNWIATGLDFPDWIELAAPRPYAVIATTSDMFPYAGALASVTEARRFYTLFAPTPDPPNRPGVTSTQASEPTPTPDPPNKDEVISTEASQPHRDAQRRDPRISPSTPTTPTLNPDTQAPTPLTAPLQFIVGPGGHGNLRPLQPQILAFFLQHLAHSTADPILPPTATPATSPLALPADLPKNALQVTSTGQVATAYPNAATVFSLNLAHAAALPKPKALTLPQLQATLRQVTAATALPGAPAPQHTPLPGFNDPAHIRHRFTLETAPGIAVQAEFYRPTSPGKHPVHLLLRDSLGALSDEEVARFTAQARAGTAVFLLAPRPSPAGTEELKSPILGPFYLLGLRAELTGKTLLGMRIDDVLRAIDFFASGETEDPTQITAEASGHEALVLLHAAALDLRLKHITLTDLPPTYAQLLADPLPRDAPQDLLPGVLLHYDTPDLIRLLGPRVTLLRTSANTTKTSR